MTSEKLTKKFMKLHNCEHSILLILPRQDRKIAKGLLFYPSYKHKETKDYCCKKRLRNVFESKEAKCAAGAISLHLLIFGSYSIRAISIIDMFGNREIRYQFSNLIGYECMGEIG